METAYTHIQKTEKIRSRIKLLPVLILTLIAVAGFWNKTIAQKSNLSDWNVPPPLPPGTTTKGNTTGKTVTVKPIVLNLNDIPAPSQPVASAVKIPDLAAVSEVSPFVTSPGRPDILTIEADWPEIPLPDAPDAPSLPQQTLQDKPVPPVTDLPVPAPPEMPALPNEPASSGQTTPGKWPIPLMPEVFSLNSPSLPPGSAPFYWSTPAIPESVSIKLVSAAGEKAIKGRRKGKHKFKSKSLRI